MKNTLFRILSTEADATSAYDKYGNDTSNYITHDDDENAGNGEFIYKYCYNGYNGEEQYGENYVYALIVGKDCTKFTPKSHTYGGGYSYSSSDELEHIFVTGGNASYVSGNYYEALINSTTNTLELGCKNTIIPSFVTSIGAGAFVNTGESITLPSSVTSIGNSAFSGCSALKSITIPSSVTSIGENTFIGCSSLESIIIPSSVESIGKSAFERCDSLKTVTIPSSSSVTSIGIGNMAFWSCRSLESITISSSVTSIGESAFERCESLNSITIPSSSSVTSIEDRAFWGCSSLESIILPSSVTSIGESAFDHCGSLESITIPSSVTSIGKRAFDQGYSLSTIRFGGTVSDWGNVTLGEDWKSRAGIEVICSDGTVTL